MREVGRGGGRAEDARVSGSEGRSEHGREHYKASM